MTQPWSDYLGQTVNGSYVLREYLGEADGVATFLAEFPDTAESGVLRLVPASSPDARIRLSSWSEAAQLSHPNLLRTMTAGESVLDGERVVYAACERPDDTLAQTLPERVLTRDEARDVLDAILPAVAYLHERGLVHGDLRAASIVAVGNTVKLTTDSISRSPDQDRDKKGIAATIVEMLTRTRPANGDLLAAARKLPGPLRAVAERNLQPIAEPVAPPSERKPLIPLLAAGAAVLAVVLGLRFFRHEPKPEPPEQQRVEYRPSPITTENPASERARTAAPEPIPQATPPVATPPPVTPPPAAPQMKPLPGWAVVAAIYNDFDAAEKRAATMRKRWPKFAPQVFPTKGEGRRYMIVLGRDMNKDAADRLREQARQAGMPEDTYVTKLFSP